MSLLIKIGHPIFCWVFFIILGLEAIRDDNFITMLIVALGLSGFSQTYWTLYLKDKHPAENADWIYFFAGGMASFSYLVLIVINCLK
ncbi:hypothetical protein [Chitinimonas sp. BJB300]|uniref:hypothetical protein n=1 Tax=Chitinimonas sp. BJB300 TaxID=1559339 RepID=UPI000C10D59A|nr:hypothetical protein [Chitinimonas sp. BJB300]PHV12237.1 hypothetical protein CSQ89_06830 [Chitinimonas sp. BJB300]TSJ85210.1 hypothetical protein FG002_018090 [Chitinimonas sp. BJB300]